MATPGNPIKIAFHRAGVLLAAIPALMALGRLNSTDAGAQHDAILVALLGCGGAYLLTFVIGSIVARFTANDTRPPR